MRQTSKHDNLISMYMLLALDIVCILAAYVLAYYCRFHVINIDSDSHKLVLLCLIIGCILYSLMFNWTRDFVNRGYLIEITAITKYNAVLLIVTAVLVFTLKQGEFYSRLVFGYFAVFNELFLIIFHIISKRILRRYLRSSHSIVRVMLISEKKDVMGLIEKLKATMPINYDLSAISIWNDRDDKDSEIEGIPVVADRNTVVDVANGMAFDEVFINLPGERIADIRELIQEFEVMGVICHYNIDISDWHGKDSTLGEFGGYSVITYAINNPDPSRLFVKRAMDIIGAVIGLCLTAICFPFIALAIKAGSKGPVIFSQTRIGKNGRRFKLYKFRSMYTDAEEKKKDLEDKNEMSGLMFKMEDDPRITRVGRFLRKTSLDELPQFYNILKGDMSLVGTRPPTEDEFENYSPYYRRRLCMTPGLTGLWQVSGRNDITDFNDVVKLDLEYIDNWNITMDFKILLQTVLVVFTGKGSK